MNKHTPGPWKLCSNELEQSFQIVAEGKPVCTLETTISSKSAKWSNKKLRPRELLDSVASENEQTNARLIAAAPELLEALKDCVKLLRVDGKTTQRAIAAIAKATGE